MITIYSTCSSLDEAKSIAHNLLKDKVIACANIIPKMTAIYTWENKVCEDEEVILLLKTKKELFIQVESKIKEMHSYEVPCIYSLNVEEVHTPYLNWLNTETL